MEKPRIAVFGATGMLALPVVEELTRQGYALTALVRDPAAAARKLPATVTLVEGNLKDPAAIAQTLQGAQGIYLNLSVKPQSKPRHWQPEREGLQNIIAAARQHDIQFIAYLSSLVQRYQGVDGFKWWVFDLKQQAVAAIKNCGIPSLIFYPSNFMENFERGAYRQGSRINLAGLSRHPMYFIAGADYARQVARAIDLFMGQSREYNVQGPKAYNADEAAHIFAQHYKKQELSIAKLPLTVLRVAGLFSPQFDYGYHIVRALNNYEEQFESQKTWAELGNPTISLPQFAASL